MFGWFLVFLFGVKNILTEVRLIFSSYVVVYRKVLLIQINSTKLT